MAFADLGIFRELTAIKPRPAICRSVFEPGNKTFAQGAGSGGAVPAGDVSTRVLLVEDTAVSAEITQAMAQRLGIRLERAANGLEGIEMVHEAIACGRPYTLLLADVMMPVVDGIEMTRQLRGAGISPAQMPIIAVTAATELSDLRAYREAGMQAFLEKPISLNDLRSVFAAWGEVGPLRKANIRKHTIELLNRQFETRKSETLAAIDQALATKVPSEETILNIRMLLHQIAGTAGSFADEALGTEAKQHETDLMDAHLAGGDVKISLRQAKDSLLLSAGQETRK